MNKKTLIIVVVILVIVGGFYYGVNSWLNGRGIQQAFQEIFTGGSSQPGLETVTDEIVIKTPEDLFKETKEVVLSSKTLPIFTENIKPKIEKVFGEARVMSYGKYSDYEGSLTASLKVPRIIVPEDLTKLEELYAGEGFETKTNEVSADSGTLVMSKDETELEFSYSGEEQIVKVWYTPKQAE